MTESQHHPKADDEEFVEFVRATDRATGEFECVACGGRAVVRGDIAPCEECGGELWERSSWSPFSNVLVGLRSRVD